MLTYSVKPARRRRARAGGLGGARPPRARRRADGARPRRRARSSATPTVPSRIVRLTAARRTVRRAHPGDARGLHRRAERPLGDGGFDIVHSQDCLSANAALALRDEGVIDARDPHRAPRRRLHLAVADRLPGPLDPRPGRAAVRLGAVGATGWPTSSASARGSSATASTPAVIARRADPAERDRDRAAAGLDGQLTILSDRRDRAAQGVADAARGIRPAARARARTATRCCWSPAGRRCSTTATRSTGSTTASQSSSSATA